MHYGGEKLGQNKGKGHRILILTFWAQPVQNRIKVVTTGAWTDRQTEGR